MLINFFFPLFFFHVSKTKWKKNKMCFFFIVHCTVYILITEKFNSFFFFSSLRFFSLHKTIRDEEEKIYIYFSSSTGKSTYLSRKLFTCLFCFCFINISFSHIDVQTMKQKFIYFLFLTSSWIDYTLIAETSNFSSISCIYLSITSHLHTWKKIYKS